MKRARPREAENKTKESGSASGEAVTAVDLNRVYEQIRALVGNRAEDMVERVLADADEGHYQAMKCLFEMVGLCPAAAPEAAAEDSLAKILLRRLKLSEEPNPATEVTEGRARDTVQPGSNAVE